MTKNTGILKVEKKSLADEVSGLIQKRISSGEMPVGTKLPTEKELSDMYGVGRSTRARGPLWCRNTRRTSPSPSVSSAHKAAIWTKSAKSSK